VIEIQGDRDPLETAPSFSAYQDAQEIAPPRPRANSVTRDGIAAKSRNITAEITPGAVTKLARYSRRDNPRTIRTPAISAGTNIANATRPIGIVEPRVRGTSKPRITHRDEAIIAISMMTASKSRAVTRPNRGTVQSSRTDPKTHPSVNTSKK